MTTRWNKTSPMAAAALPGATGALYRAPALPPLRQQPGRSPGAARVAGLDAWLAAEQVRALFPVQFLWASDCGRRRFAALGESRRVAYSQLAGALQEASDEWALRGQLAERLPLGMFVLGDTDQRPGAFTQGETETATRCWVPRVLLLQERDSLLVFCADPHLRRDLARQLEATVAGQRKTLLRLIRNGICPGRVESPLDTPGHWRQRVDLALDAIEAGRLQKLVVSRRLHIHPAAEPFSPYLSAWQAGQAGGRTGFTLTTDGGRSVFTGATPETLLRVRSGRISTHALAGTRPGAAALEDFMTSAKLRQEHALVSGGLVSSLAPFTRDIKPGALRVRRAGTVTHLETPLEGTLPPGTDPLVILQVLHPTAAIGGWPKQQAQEALRQIEPYSRGWFAAPLGWISANGDMHAAIAIRSLWVSAERAVALAGAGIVRGSAAEEEWAETETKFDNMRAVIRGTLFGG